MRYAKVLWVVLAQAALMAAGQPGSAQTPGCSSGRLIGPR